MTRWLPVALLLAACGGTTIEEQRGEICTLVDDNWAPDTCAHMSTWRCELNGVSRWRMQIVLPTGETLIELCSPGDAAADPSLCDEARAAITGCHCPDTCGPNAANLPKP